MNAGFALALTSSAFFGGTLVWYLAPRTFVLLDRRAARSRLASRPTRTPIHPADDSAHHRPPVPSLERPQRSESGTDLVVLAALCNSVARATRSGVPAHDSLVQGIDTIGIRTDWVRQLHHDIADGVTLGAALVRAEEAAPADDATCLSLLGSSAVGINLVPAAVDHAAEVLRGIARCRGELQVAVSHTRFSLRILTVLPFGLLALSFLASGTFRASLFSLRAVVPILLGFAINRAGSSWMDRIIDRAVADAHSDPLTDLIDRVCVSLRAGRTVAQACETIDQSGTPRTSRLAADIAGRVRAGQPLDEALEPLGVHHGLAGRMFADVLVGAERDGLPVVPLVTRIALEVRTERQHRIDVAVRQLPSKLAIPLVLCVLPAFLLITLVPLVVSSLGALTIRLPLSSPVP